MSFQFDTNWPGYIMKFGNIAGPLLAYTIYSYWVSFGKATDLTYD